MDNYALFTKSISLKNSGIENAKIHYQLSADELHKITLQSGQGIKNSSSFQKDFANALRFQCRKSR